MQKELITNDKLYELLIQDKNHKEGRRDQINSYYITLFTAIIGGLPFIEQLTKGINSVDKAYIVRISLSILALIALVLSLTWASTLKRILLHLEILDERIQKVEDSYNLSYLTYINQQLTLKNAPGRVTKYQLVLPYTFAIIFATAIIYSLLWLLM